MNFELTISGLNIIVLKSAEDRPKNPDNVDVICPAADMHRARLSYAPEDCVPARTFEPELVVGRGGERIASEDCRKHRYKVTFVNDIYERKFNLKWSPLEYSEPLTEEFMDWLPSLDDLGFKGFRVGSGIPHGAASRFSLPPGDVTCYEITRDPHTNETLLWNFPSAYGGDGMTCALANLIVYRATDIQTLQITRDRKTILTSTLPNNGTLRMCLSNDMANVPYDYNDPQESLKHLEHLKCIVKEKVPFVAPRIVPREKGGQRTGHPICNGVVFVDKSGGAR